MEKQIKKERPKELELNYDWEKDLYDYEKNVYNIGEEEMIYVYNTCKNLKSKENGRKNKN